LSVLEDDFELNKPTFPAKIIILVSYNEIFLVSEFNLILSGKQLFLASKNLLLFNFKCQRFLSM
jgi:hypothetical protein